MLSDRPDHGERIRVLRLITRLNVGGPAQQALLLTERLDRARFDTELVVGQTGRGEGDMMTLRPTHVSPVVIPGLGREISPLVDTRALLRVVRVVRRFRPHVVHTHLAKAGFIGRVAARLSGTPVIVHTFHGHAFRGYFDPFRTRVFLEVERALARISTRIIAISPGQKDEIRQLRIASEPKLIMVPLGIELTSFLDPPCGALRHELGLGQDVPLIGIVGRLVPIKAVDVFVDAMALVARKRLDARFVIVGDGELRPSLEARAQRVGLGDRLFFLGWRPDLRLVYGDLDVVVLTSDNEGTPVSVLEALAAGRAVVATAVGGVPDVLGQSERGILVPRREPSSVADAVMSLLQRADLRERLGRAGRLHVHPAYDVGTLVARVEALYTDLVNR